MEKAATFGPDHGMPQHRPTLRIVATHTCSKCGKEVVEVPDQGWPSYWQEYSFGPPAGWKVSYDSTGYYEYLYCPDCQ
jgi:hypothetical protein